MATALKFDGNFCYTLFFVTLPGEGATSKEVEVSNWGWCGTPPKWPNFFMAYK